MTEDELKQRVRQMMTDDDVQGAVQRMLAAQATHREILQDVATNLAKTMSDLMLANQALEMSREAGMALLQLLEARRGKNKEEAAGQ